MLGAFTGPLVHQPIGEAIVHFAGLAMGLNGLATAFLFPLLARLWGM